MRRAARRIRYNLHVVGGPKDRVVAHFPRACVVADSRKRWRVVLWPGCGVTVAEGPTARQAWEAAAEIVERDLRH